MHSLKVILKTIANDSWRCLQSVVIFFLIFKIIQPNLTAIMGKKRKHIKKNYQRDIYESDDETGTKSSRDLVFIRNLCYDFFCRKRKLFDKLSTLPIASRRKKSQETSDLLSSITQSDSVNITVYQQYFDGSKKEYQVSPYDRIKHVIRLKNNDDDILIHEGRIIKDIEKTFNDYGIKNMSILYRVKSDTCGLIRRKFSTRIRTPLTVKIVACNALILLWTFELTALRGILYPLITVSVLWLIPTHIYRKCFCS